MKVIPASVADLYLLALNPCEDQVAQYAAVTGRVWDPSEVATEHFRRPGVKFVMVDDDNEPFAAGGYDEVSPGVWHDWMLTTPDAWGKHWRALTKASRRVMDGVLAGGAVRLQTAAMEGRGMACKWYVKGLKMKYVGTVPGYGLGGENFVLYERMKEADRG